MELPWPLDRRRLRRRSNRQALSSPAGHVWILWRAMPGNTSIGANMSGAAAAELAGLHLQCFEGRRRPSLPNSVSRVATTPTSPALSFSRRAEMLRATGIRTAAEFLLSAGPRPLAPCAPV